MKIGERIRHAGEKSIERARQEWQEAKESIHDVQRRIRQRMRVFPRRKDDKDLRMAGKPVPSNPSTEENLPYVKPTYQGIQLRKTKPIFSSGNRDLKGGTEPAA